MEMRTIHIRKDIAIRLKLVATLRDEQLQELASRILDEWLRQHAANHPNSIPAAKPNDAGD